MKKYLLFATVLIFLIPCIRMIAQDTKRRIGGSLKELSKVEEGKYLKQLSEGLKNKLVEIKETDKNRYYYLLKKAAQREYVVQNNPEEYMKQMEEQHKKNELEVEAALYVIKYKKADDTAKQKIKNDLQAALNKLFELNESEKMTEVKFLENRLKELKESLQTRKQNKNEIVQRRVYEMLNDSKDLGWE